MADDRGMRVIPKAMRNAGESYGLEYPYICRTLHITWDRHTGKIMHIECCGVPLVGEVNGRRKCRELNGLSDEHDPAMNILHDLEA